MTAETDAQPEVDGDCTLTSHSLTLSSGLTVHYVSASRANATSGRTMLALHGMGSYGGSWRAVLKNVPTLDRAILPDLRGHGRSDWTTSGYWLTDYADDLIELVDRLQIGPLDLAGHSLGARIAMVLAPRLADRLRTMTLSDTGPEVSREGALKAKAIAANGAGAKHFRDPAAITTALRAEHPDWAPEAVDLRVRMLFRENWAGRWVPRGDPEVEHLLGRAGLREVPHMWEGLAATTAPTLILRGLRSYLLDDTLTDRMVDALADATVVPLDLSHEMLYVRPDLVGHTIDKFLRGHEGRPQRKRETTSANPAT